MALYTETVMDHFTHPRNVGEIPDANGVGEVGNAKCGDIIISSGPTPFIGDIEPCNT